MDYVIEIRTYVLKEGTSKSFHQTMMRQSVPLLKATGTDVLDFRPSMHSADTYLLMRAYKSLADRAQSQEEFYGSDAWTQGPRDAIMACIESYTTAVIDADGAQVDCFRQITHRS
jgi:hypothetical protein